MAGICFIFARTWVAVEFWLVAFLQREDGKYHLLVSKRKLPVFKVTKSPAPDTGLGPEEWLEKVF